MTIPFITNGVWYIDNSSFEKITACERMADYAIAEKRELTQPRHALSFGGAIHAGLAAMFNGQDFVAALTDAFADIIVPPGDHRDLAYATEMLTLYKTTQFTFQNWEVIRSDAGTPQVEQSFAFPLGEVHAHQPGQLSSAQTIKVVFTGRIDLIIRWRGDVWIVDHKTRGRKENMAEFNNSSQMKGYVWAVRQHLGRLPQGYIMNILYTKKPTKSGMGIEFVDQTYDLDYDRVAEWRENFLATCQSYLTSYINDRTKMFTTSCWGRYGACQFLDVCTLPPANRNLLLHSGAYQDVTWSPLEQPHSK